MKLNLLPKKISQRNDCNGVDSGRQEVWGFRGSNVPSWPITALGKGNRNPTLEKTRSTAVIGGSGRSLGTSGYSSKVQPENNLSRQVDLIWHKPMRHSDFQQQP
jgi:hypothetical protein